MKRFHFNEIINGLCFHSSYVLLSNLFDSDAGMSKMFQWSFVENPRLLQWCSLNIHIQRHTVRAAGESSSFLNTVSVVLCLHPSVSFLSFSFLSLFFYISPTLSHHHHANSTLPLRLSVTSSLSLYCLMCSPTFIPVSVFSSATEHIWSPASCPLVSLSPSVSLYFSPLLVHYRQYRN